MGYEPVLFERGHIAYSTEEPLEDSAYDEIKTCDILIAIIGGQFGIFSRKDKSYSYTLKKRYNRHRERAFKFTPSLKDLCLENIEHFFRIRSELMKYNGLPYQTSGYLSSLKEYTLALKQFHYRLWLC